VQALLLRFPNRQIRKQFKELDYDKKNNTIIYVMQLLFTTVALITQLYGSSNVIFRWQDSTTHSKLNSLIFAVLMIAVLYIALGTDLSQEDWPSSADTSSCYSPVGSALHSSLL
jgi:uncharacterized BrkB/YihY/UPF0761 family membrane protein